MHAGWLVVSFTRETTHHPFRLGQPRGCWRPRTDARIRKTVEYKSLEYKAKQSFKPSRSDFVAALFEVSSVSLTADTSALRSPSFEMVGDLTEAAVTATTPTGCLV